MQHGNGAQEGIDPATLCKKRVGLAATTFSEDQRDLHFERGATRQDAPSPTGSQRTGGALFMHPGAVIPAAD
jgi:hypothetical protein